MVKRITVSLIVLSLFFIGQTAFYYKSNREINAQIANSRKANAELTRQVIFLKSLTPGPSLPDLELSYLRLQTEIAALREVGGTLANAVVQGIVAGQPITAAATRIRKTPVVSVPVAIEIKEYKYLEGLLEALASLNRGNVFFESLKYDNGLFIKTRLFGRIANGEN